MSSGTYSWQVRAKDAAGNWGPASDARTVTIFLPVPAAPVLISPAIELVTDGTTPTFSWAAVPFGFAYQIQVASDKDFNNILFDTAVMTASYTPGTVLDDGVYFWRVQAVNHDLVASPWSVSRSFTIKTTPILFAPADFAVVVGSTPAFLWRSSTSVSIYQFEYADNPGFSGGDVYSVFVQFGVHTPYPRMVSGTYYWHVRAQNTIGSWSTWSDTRTVTIYYPVPAAPVLIAPAFGLVTGDTTPTFIWTAMPFGASYQIQIASDKSFDIIYLVRDKTGVDVIRTLYTGLADGDYYWRVRAKNVKNEPGPWSDVWMLTISTPSSH